MNTDKFFFNRRRFIKTTATSLTGLAVFPQQVWPNDISIEDGIHIIGPKQGYSPQIGTLVSMMNWMRTVALRSVQGMKQKELDYLHDPTSNTIGAMLLHLAATEAYYQIHTFEEKKWGDWSEQDKQKWSPASSLGEAARKTIKGNDLDYYLNILTETREKTLHEFQKRDDKWLMKVDPSFFGNQPTNNYCKWFHVCEHESNHNGQIKWIKSRLPGAKQENG